MVPRWLKGHLNETDVKAIGQAVAEAEGRTSGEIVPVIVQASSSIEHIPLLLFFIMLATSLVVDDIIQTYWWHVPWYALIAGALLGVLAMPLASLPKVQRLLTSRTDQRRQVMQRAQLEFHRADISHTSGHTGVLIFLSMAERQAVVLADKAIADLLPPETWAGVINLILSGARAGQLAQGLESGIRKVGDLLAERFPRTSDDKNELPNDLIMKDFE